MPSFFLGQHPAACKQPSLAKTRLRHCSAESALRQVGRKRLATAIVQKQKVIMLGSTSIGKSTLLQRNIIAKFHSNLPFTVWTELSGGEAQETQAPVCQLHIVGHLGGGDVRGQMLPKHLSQPVQQR